MIQLVTIKTDSIYYRNVSLLMRSAFPANERRACAHQKLITDYKSSFCCYAMLENQTFAGFITTWNLNHFVFIEHLAILEKFRGRGFGSQAVEQVLNSNKSVVLEVELPTSKNAIRRIEFYQRLGFVAWQNSKYAQPSYKPNGKGVPMLLMIHGNFSEVEDFELIKNEIHGNVYGIK